MLHSTTELEDISSVSDPESISDDMDNDYKSEDSGSVCSKNDYKQDCSRQEQGFNSETDTCQDRNDEHVYIELSDSGSDNCVRF